MKQTLSLVSLAFLLAFNSVAIAGEAQNQRNNGPNADVELAAYVKRTDHVEGERMAIVLEVTNKSKTPLRIATTPLTRRVTESEVERSPRAAIPFSPDSAPTPLTVAINAVYPAGSYMKGT